MEEVSIRQSKKTMSEIGQSDTLLEGRANAFTVDVETKIEQKMGHLKDTMLRAEQNRNQKIQHAVEMVDEKMAMLTERFDQRFRTNEQLKHDLDQQMELIVKSAVNDVKNAFLQMNENNKKAMEKLAAEIEAKGFVGDDDDRLELQKLRDKTLYEYMDTLINTAKIGLEAQIKHIKASSSDDMDGRLIETIGQI